MKRNLYLTGAIILLAAALLTPGLGLAQAKPGSQMMQKEKLTKDLGLTADKAKTFMAVGEKYQGSRQGIIAEIKDNEAALEKAMAAAKLDEAKIKGLVAAITAAHSKLWDTFRAQRQEEMTLLTPVQQGKFLMALKKWHREMCVKFEKPGQKK